MMKIHKIIILIGCLTASLGLHAQNISDMRLNEFLVINTDDFEDDYGHKNGWIELFNTFHINFRLEDSDEILFVSSDGRTIVDRIKIDHSIASPNVSYGRTNDGIGSTDGSGEGWEIMKKTSPSTNNVILDGESNSMKLKKLDPYGIIMAITAMSVVFVALIILYLLFKWIGNLSIKKHQKRSDDVAKQNDKAEHKFEETSAEAYAAIALALHLYREETELHDVEWEYGALWIQCGIYFITTCIVYRWQIIRSRKHAIKAHLEEKRLRSLQTDKTSGTIESL